MNRIVFPGDSLAQLRAELLTFAPNEAACVLIAGHAITKDSTRLLVRERHLVPENHYTVQQEYRVVLSPHFLMPLLKRARNEGWSLVFCHTHPFSDHVTFSPIDDVGEAETMPVVFGRTKGQCHGSLVLGTEGSSARIYNSANHRVPEVSVAEVGKELRIDNGRTVSAPIDLSPKFDRSVRAFGAMGQAILSRLTVGIVGLGGIGSIVSEELAHLGIGRFILLDQDSIEETNLNRVVGTTPEAVGRRKVDVAADMIRRIRHDTEVHGICGDVMQEQDARSLLDADFIVGCTDSHGSRTVINQLAYQYMLPAVDMGVRVLAKGGKIEAMAGRVQMLSPGLACLVCSNLLDSEEVRRDFLSPEARAIDPYILGANEPQPAVISLNGSVASLGVTMILSAVVGLPVAARHQIVRFERGTVRSVAQQPNPSCVVCSLKGALGRGDMWPLPTKPC